MMRSVMAACALAGGLLLTFVAGSAPATAGEAQAADAQASYYRSVYRGPRGGVAVRTTYYGSRGYYRGYRGGYGYRTGYYGGPRYYGGYRGGYYSRPYGYGYGYRVASSGYYGDYNGDGYPDAGYYGGGYSGVGYYGGGWGSGGCREAYIPYGWTWYRATSC